MLYPNIRKEIATYNVSVGELAGYMGISRIALRQKLRGKREFTLLDIEKMSEFFCCSLDYLVGHTVLKERLDRQV